MLGLCHMNLGATYIKLGDPVTAGRHLAHCQKRFKQAQVREFQAELHRYLAEAALQVGDLITAKKEGQCALASARELSMRGEEGVILYVLGQIATRQKQYQEAETLTLQSISLLKDVNDDHNLTRSQSALAGLRALRG